MNIIEKKKPMSGDFEIIRTPVAASGASEVILKEKNTITSGLSAGLSKLFGGVGSQTITDYIIDRFQVGTGGSAGLSVSSTRALATPLTKAEYDAGTNLEVQEHYLYDSQDANNQSDSAQAFALIPRTMRTAIGDHSVRFTLVLDENTANTENLDEIGLFMKNPAGFADNTSMLCAYKYFGPLTKTSEFSLTFRWTLNL